ncbi:MAG: hypothetical protein ABJM18_06855 [Hyphomonas sp.]
MSIEKMLMMGLALAALVALGTFFVNQAGNVNDIDDNFGNVKTSIIDIF